MGKEDIWAAAGACQKVALASLWDAVGGPSSGIPPISKDRQTAWGAL